MSPVGDAFAATPSTQIRLRGAPAKRVRPSEPIARQVRIHAAEYQHEKRNERPGCAAACQFRAHETLQFAALAAPYLFGGSLARSASMAASTLSVNVSGAKA